MCVSVKNKKGHELLKTVVESQMSMRVRYRVAAVGRHEIAYYHHWLCLSLSLSLSPVSYTHLTLPTILRV